MNDLEKHASKFNCVNVHLPNGCIITGKCGASASDILKGLEPALPAPIVGVIVNGKLCELTYVINSDVKLTPVTMADADGALIYRRSLTFLLSAVFSELFPEDKLTIDHSVASGGYFCQVKNWLRFSTQELANLKKHMQQLVAKDAPFRKQEVSISEAIAYFEAKGYIDKVRLLHFRQKEYVTLYRLGDYLDYHHGYMVPSTGYMKWFDLLPSEEGFILRFPQRNKPTELQAIPRYPKLLTAFRQYGQWLERLGIDSVGALNDAIKAGRSREVVLISEALHEQSLAMIAQQIAERSRQARVILIAGPSSSGKTTFSRRLAIQLLTLGLYPLTLGLDNYFIDREKTPRDENGYYNFEALEALDLNLLGDHLQQLIARKPVLLPRYDFKIGKRVSGEIVELTSEHIIILEGIHGLNPKLIPKNIARNVFRIYVSCLTQLNLDRQNRVSTTDTRLVRRIVRDARERNYSAQQTINHWESVRRGEESFIFPYQENTDTMFNSALAYELSAIKLMAEPLLQDVASGKMEHIEAKRLLAFLEWFLPIESEWIPDDSILREFIGGSILQDFHIWKA